MYGDTILVFMLLEQLFKAAPCGLVRGSARIVLLSFCQKAHDLKILVGKDEVVRPSLHGLR